MLDICIILLPLRISMFVSESVEGETTSEIVFTTVVCLYHCSGIFGISFMQKKKTECLKLLLKVGKVVFPSKSILRKNVEIDHSKMKRQIIEKPSPISGW